MKKKELNVVAVKSKGTRKRKRLSKTHKEKKIFRSIIAILEFLNQQINRLPGTIFVAFSMTIFEYGHEVLKKAIGPIDYKIVMTAILICFVAGVKSCFHSAKEKAELKQEVSRLKSENKKLRDRL